ncbi:hypothetical protein V9Z49_10805, partial [Streptococcus suis]|uniref:hypothetical protein n=1 Tax=Streptococcus suis TaxID=1307 RepID=UPI00301052F0
FYCEKLVFAQPLFYCEKLVFAQPRFCSFDNPTVHQNYKRSPRGLADGTYEPNMREQSRFNIF